MQTSDAKALEAAVWYQIDARFLYAQVPKYLEQPSNWWIAVKVQKSAANSAARARKALLIE